MGREPVFEELLRQLEEKVGTVQQQFRELRAEQGRLEARIARLEAQRAQAVERINAVLDRIETEG